MSALTQIHVLAAGAAKGLVLQMQDSFFAQSGLHVNASFGAVGMMKEQLLAGAPCDVILLTDALIGQLTSSGQVLAGSGKALGAVKTGIAVKDGAVRPSVASANDLAQTLRSATGIYFPDPVKATAGIHFMRVLRHLGLEAELADRLHPYPNGAAAMQALAWADDNGAVGCTQASEIIFAPGVQLVAALPKEFELATIYSAAVAGNSMQAGAAAAFIELLASQQAAAIRSAGGFE